MLSERRCPVASPGGRYTGKLSGFVRRSVAVAIVLGCLISPSARSGVPEIPYDYQLKTVYLFKFTEYVEWPAEQTGPFRLCFWTLNPFPQATAAARSSWNGRREINLVVVSPQDVTSRCDLLYVPEEQAISKEKLASFAATGTLIVGEGRAFLSNGGMIRFLNVGQSIAFDINLAALQSAGLRVSSSLLRVARHVEEP